MISRRSVHEWKSCAASELKWCGVNRSDPPSHLRRRPPAPALPPIPVSSMPVWIDQPIVPVARQVNRCRSKYSRPWLRVAPQVGRAARRMSIFRPSRCFRMTLKTNVPPREAAAPSIVECERECVIRTPRWSEADSNPRSHRLSARTPGFAARFAADSAREREGFEPSVPPARMGLGAAGSALHDRRRHREARNADRSR